MSNASEKEERTREGEEEGGAAVAEKSVPTIGCGENASCGQK